MHAVPECQSVLSRLAELLEGTLAENEEERVRDHLASCDACREKAVAKDPTLLFTALRDRQQSEFFWAGMWRDLQDEIEDKNLRPRPHPRRLRRRLIGAAAVVAAAGLVGVLTLYGPDPMGQPDGVAENTASPIVPERNRLPQLEPPVIRAEEAIQRVFVEDENATIVEIESPTPIVMVYNKNIDI